MKVKCDGPLSKRGFNFKLSHYSLAFEWTATSSEVRPVEVLAHVAFTQGRAVQVANMKNRV